MGGHWTDFQGSFGRSVSGDLLKEFLGFHIAKSGAAVTAIGCSVDKAVFDQPVSTHHERGALHPDFSCDSLLDFRNHLTCGVARRETSENLPVSVIFGLGRAVGIL